jgi:hypothetical protein
MYFDFYKNKDKKNIGYASKHDKSNHINIHIPLVNGNFHFKIGPHRKSSGKFFELWFRILKDLEEEYYPPIQI